jgi:hypothetical protein
MRGALVTGSFIGRPHHPHLYAILAAALLALVLLLAAGDTPALSLVMG